MALLGLQNTSDERRIVETLLVKAGILLGGNAEHDVLVRDDRFFSSVIEDGPLGLGESYVAGWWDSPRLDLCLEKILREGARPIRIPWSLKWQWLQSTLLNMQTPSRARRVAVQHYDVSNYLYERMLDPWMQYTCAFYGEADNLNKAQEQKLDQICRKLELKPGERLLELGCGFGGLAKFAAERYGCQIVGYNISKQQIAWARNWTKGLPVEIIEGDYRSASGQFDKAVAVGLCEHVGYKNYRSLMQVANRCLKPGGLFLLNHVGGNESRVTTDPWLEKYIFPGSVMPSASQFARSYEGIFVMEDWQNFGVDYGQTCLAWFQNFDAHWNEIKAQGFDDRFYRMWKYYLLLCAASFFARKNQNWEIVLAKGGARTGYRAKRY